MINSKYLDGLMTAMLEERSHDENILKEMPHVKAGNYNTARQMLVDRKYVLSVYKDHLQLTPEGIRFIQGGGFTMEDKIQKSSLQTLKVTQLTLWVAIATFIVGMIALIIAL